MIHIGDFFGSLLNVAFCKYVCTSIVDILPDDTFTQIAWFSGMAVSPYLVKTLFIEVLIMCFIKCHLETDFVCALVLYKEETSQCHLGHFDGNVESQHNDGDVFILTGNLMTC